jgi:Na+-translocating ferredoxin:NAD+ oxidoreductase subunit G
MKKFSFKELLLPGIILFAICLATTFLLAFTNELTAPKITELAAKNADAARKNVLANADSFSDSLQVDLSGKTYEYYEGFEPDGKTAAGYVFITVTKGYGGDVKMMTGIDAKGSVAGLEILQLSETPGLGMKAYDDFFLKQFFGKDGSIAVDKNAAGEHSIKAITGATITSNAVAGAVNIALELYDVVTGKAKPDDESAAKADEALRKQLLPQAESFQKTDNIIVAGESYDYHTGKTVNGETAGYIFTTQATGYSGIVMVSTGVDSKGVITGVKVLATNDTPGLGTNVKNDSFLDQFKGLSGKVILTKGTPGENAVAALTGATLSSSAVINAVNKALDLYQSIAGGTQ